MSLNIVILVKLTLWQRQICEDWRQSNKTFRNICFPRQMWLSRKINCNPNYQAGQCYQTGSILYWIKWKDILNRIGWRMLCYLLILFLGHLGKTAIYQKWVTCGKSILLLLLWCLWILVSFAGRLLQGAWNGRGTNWILDRSETYHRVSGHTVLASDIRQVRISDK